jgi:hypothetical protein
MLGHILKNALDVIKIPRISLIFREAKIADEAKPFIDLGYLCSNQMRIDEASHQIGCGVMKPLQGHRISIITMAMSWEDHSRHLPSAQIDR